MPRIVACLTATLPLRITLMSVEVPPVSRKTPSLTFSRISAPATPARNTSNGHGLQTPVSAHGTPGGADNTPSRAGDEGDTVGEEEEEDAPEKLLLDPALMLPFTLPSVTDMLVSYGAGFGGVNRERERKYIPTVPPEFLEKLEVAGRGDKGPPMFGEKDWENEEI